MSYEISCAGSVRLRAALAIRIFIARPSEKPLREKEGVEKKELVLSNSLGYDECTCNGLLRKADQNEILDSTGSASRGNYRDTFLGARLA